MITIKNYHETIKSKGIKRSDLNEKLQKGWDFVEKIWQSGKGSWKAYESSEKIKNTVDTYFKLMDELIQKKDSSQTKKPDGRKKKTSSSVTQSKKKVSTKKTGRKWIHNSLNSSFKKGLNELKKVVDQVIGKMIDIETELDGEAETVVASTRMELEDLLEMPNDTLIRGRKTVITLKKIADEMEDWVDSLPANLHSKWKGFQDKLLKVTHLFHSKPNNKTGSKSRQAKPKHTGSRKSKPKAKPKTRNTKKSYVDPNAKKVEAFNLEHKFIKRFVNIDEKAKTRNQIRLFISALQKAIREKRIRKSSKYAKEIIYIQDALIKFHAKFKDDNEKIEVVLPAQKKAAFLKILGRQIEIPSVKLIKSYINLQGKLIPNDKAKNLYNRIVRAIDKGKITKRDKYWKEIESILERLTTFVKKNPTSGVLTIESRALNGLEGIVGDCGCEPQFESFGRIPDNVVMSSVDVLKLKFEKLGFTGKWLDFIGNPAKNFSMMIFGLPKYGKSILAIAFASYLANNFGTVLYVAREEGIDDTLQEKLEKVAHPDLFVVGSLPDDLEQFDFIFLDSVNKLGMTPKDIDALRAKYPGKGFVSVFQTRKDGNFRGSQEFQHDVDIVIELPEIGRAVQYGRYNQGGEMNIFSGSLDGIKKK